MLHDGAIPLWWLPQSTLLLHHSSNAPNNRARAISGACAVNTMRAAQTTLFHADPLPVWFLDLAILSDEWYATQCLSCTMQLQWKRSYKTENTQHQNIGPWPPHWWVHQFLAALPTNACMDGLAKHGRAYACALPQQPRSYHRRPSDIYMQTLQTLSLCRVCSRVHTCIHAVVLAVVPARGHSRMYCTWAPCQVIHQMCICCWQKSTVSRSPTKCASTTKTHHQESNQTQHYQNVHAISRSITWQ